LYDSCTTFKNQYIVYPDYQDRWDYGNITDKEQYEADIWVSRIMAYNLNVRGSSESGWQNETGSNGTDIPPSLTLFSPTFNGLDVNINGVVFPGTPGTKVTRISWDWGDGSSEDHCFASSHTYAEAGQYTITVTAYQSDGLNTTESNQILLSLPESEAQAVNDYLVKDHDYRSGALNVSSTAYILCSGSGYNDQGMNYSAIFNSTIELENVTEAEFMNCIGNPEGSQLFYLTAHSCPQLHSLYDGYITTEDLQNMNKTAIFYILNACSACRWDQCVSDPNNPNYLGGLYIFDTSALHEDYGLCAMGFSGVGGFNNLNYFTDYLNANPGSTYAEAYKYWFNQNLMIIFGPNNYVILGDPTLQPNMMFALSVAVSPSSIVMNVGQSQLFSSSVSDGTAPYAYQWYLNGTAVSGATNATWNFTPGSSGSYDVYVNVTDNVGSRASNIASATVNPVLSVRISPTSATLDAGQSQLFTPTVSGGTSPYSYQWYLNGSAVLGATNATWTFTPTSAGSYTVYAKVTDSVRAQATSNTAAITASSTVPEFPPYLILPLFMMATLLAALVLKRKRNVRTCTRD
jgi:hypothetical protein